MITRLLRWLGFGFLATAHDHDLRLHALEQLLTPDQET